MSDDEFELEELTTPRPLDGSGRRLNSSFSFDLHAIPLSLSIGPADRHQGNTTRLTPGISLLSGIALIIGICIGSGIFSSPGPILNYAGSVPAALSVWIAAGLLAMTGALCYAELGTMIPDSGGEHAYLSRV
jgi:hypothetical protein